MNEPFAFEARPHAQSTYCFTIYAVARPACSLLSFGAMFRTSFPLPTFFAGICALAATASSPARAAENTNRSNAEPVCRRGDVIFCEDWEDGDSAGWSDWKPVSSSGVLWGGLSCSPGSCDFPYSGYDSSHTAALHLVQNNPDSMYPMAAFNTPAGVDDTLYVRWYAYFSPNFEWNTTNTKHIYLLPNSGAATWEVPFFFRPQNGPVNRGMPYFHFYCSLIDVVPGSDVERACTDSGGDVRYFPNQPGFENFRVSPGNWYAVEFMVKPNPSGQSFGGHISAWIDGNKVIDYDNVSVRHAGISEPLNLLWITTYFGGGGSPSHPDQYVLYDDIVISKSYIGPISGSIPIADAGHAGDGGPGGDSGARADAGHDADASSNGGLDAGRSDAGGEIGDSGHGCGVTTGAKHDGTVTGWVVILGLVFCRTGRRRISK